MSRKLPLAAHLRSFEKQPIPFYLALLINIHKTTDVFPMIPPQSSI